MSFTEWKQKFVPQFKNTSKIVVNINNTEQFEVEDYNEAVKLIEEKMSAWMKKSGYRLTWFYDTIPKSFDTPADSAVILNEFGKWTNDFSTIIYPFNLKLKSSTE